MKLRFAGGLLTLALVTSGWSQDAKKNGVPRVFEYNACPRGHSDSGLFRFFSVVPKIPNDPMVEMMITSVVAGFR